MLGVIIKVLGTTLVLGACAGTAMFMLHRIENPMNEYATYSEMEAGGLMVAGWIPKVIPKSAYAITETHNLDTNAVQISFSFSPGDTNIAADKCRLTSTSGMESVFYCSAGNLTLTTEGHGFFTSEREIGR